MATHVDVEELQATRSEKLLAVVMTIFLLIGGVWTYQKLDDYVGEGIVKAGTAADRAAVERRDRASLEVSRAFTEQGRARSELELRREAYRTALDAGQPAEELERRYREAERAHDLAAERVARAQRELRAAEPAARAAERRISTDFDRKQRRRDLVTFLLRLAFVVISFVGGLVLLGRLRNRNSRYLPLAAALVGAATILAFVLTGDYLTDYLEPYDVGLLALSVVGVAATLLAFFGLQRYISRPLPQRRVRKRQCPFCGFRESGGDHCESCGRQIVAPCARCGGHRRVGSLHCRACGAG